MSKHYRNEKDCLNCGTTVNGKFCPECGQENVEPKESFVHLFGHFFGHYFHFDSKFWSSIKPLLFKPGFLTLEYSLGRRVSYVNPLNLYFFISVVFFLVNAITPSVSRTNYVITPSGIRATDSLGRIADTLSGDSVYSGRYMTITSSDTSDTNEYKTPEEYIDAQSKLPEEKRDGFIRRAFNKRYIQLQHDPAKMEASIKEKFMKNIPKLMFIMLPIFALLIHLFYLNRKKYFVENVIFSIHFHSFVFLIFLFTVLFEALIPFDISFIAILLSIVYLYFASKRVFQQSRTKTFFKTAGIVVFYMVLLAFGQVINMIISMMMI